MGHRLVSAAAPVLPRARASLDPGQQLGQRLLRGYLVGGRRAAHVAGAQRPIQRHEPGHAVPAEVARPQITLVRAPGIVWAVRIAGPMTITRWWTGVGHT
jgi:hypothetical protein